MTIAKSAWVLLSGLCLTATRSASASAATIAKHTATTKHITAAVSKGGLHPHQVAEGLALGAIILLVCGAVIYAFWLISKKLGAIEQQKVNEYQDAHDR